MKDFQYIRATDIPHAISALESDPDSKLLAGGTNLVDLMKYDVATPSTVVDINRLPMRSIEEATEGGIFIGALATNTAVAFHPAVVSRYPLLSSAILAGASGQLRNVATVGGNLLQRTRCPYFYDVQTACNKREPGQGCAARAGLNRNHAILGASDHCIATHPSDMCVAMEALDAVVTAQGPNGSRSIPFAQFHRLPGDSPDIDSTLGQNELITGIGLPTLQENARQSYLKIRDRLSYAFALVSVAVIVAMDGERIGSAAVALGGVAHKPWRNREAESFLEGQAPSAAVFSQFASMLLEGAVAQAQNAFKIDLAHRAIVRCLTQAVFNTPQSQDDKRVS
ncbi:xanthine dehydrogenase YagS FAD-binding subunit [Luteibacter sp. HA06]